jgi:hypothetical protein
MENQNPNNSSGSIFRDSTSSDDYVSRKVAELIKQEDFRKRTIEIIVEHTESASFMEKINGMIVAHTGTVEFEELVMKYAGKEYENRLLKSGRFLGFYNFSRYHYFGDISSNSYINHSQIRLCQRSSSKS